MKYSVTGIGNLEVGGADLRFWVVIDPRIEGLTDPVLQDCVFESNPFSFALQIRGGLKPQAVREFYLYKDANKAMRAGKAMLEDAKANPTRESRAAQSLTRTRYERRRSKT